MKKTILLFIALSFSVISFSRTFFLLEKEGYQTPIDTPSNKKHIYEYNPLYRASNTLSIDIIHTNLYVKFNWDSSLLYGKAEILLKSHFYALDKIYLNARGMRINSIKISDHTSKADIPFSYKYENDSIKISLNKKYTSSQQLLATINYVAQPEKLKEGGSNAIQSDKGLYFINPKNEVPGKLPQIWTQGETQSNSVWFPTVDSPNEKMTQDIYITVDKKYTTLSNGLLTDIKDNKDGTKTDHWKMDLPHAPYLVMMAIGEFKKVTDKPWKGKEISYYVEPAYEPYAKAIFGNTYKMIDFFSNKLGVDFAWPKYGQIIARDYVSGAMENTSATLHGEFLYQTDRDTVGGVKGESVISHELFHQWFGDLATCESWSNLPLNESFATYGEYLWNEYFNGRDAADENHYRSGRGYFGRHGSVDNSPALIRYFYSNREDMFDGVSYNKGGQVLHMLRKLVGDDAFFQSLKLYLTQNKFKATEIHHLRLAFEETTGQDLQWFFNQWFMYGGHPMLQINKSYNADSKILTLTIQQNQPEEFPIYKLPVDIDIYLSKETIRKKIIIDEAAETFTFQVSENPLLVNFDTERQLLAKIDYPKSTEEYMYQFEHAPLWLDRYEAITNLKDKLNNNTVLEFFITKVLKDKYAGIRSEAINILKSKIKDNSNLKEVIKTIAQKDMAVSVKADAIASLSETYDENILLIYKNTLDKEYSSELISVCLYGLNKNNKDMADMYAKKFENDKSKSIIMAVTAIYSESGKDTHFDFMIKNLSTFTGFETFGYMSMLGKYLKKVNSSGYILNAAKTISTYYKNGGKMNKFAAQKVLNDITNVWSDKEKNLKKSIEEAKKNNNPTQSLEDELKTVSETAKNLKEIVNKFGA